MMITKRELMARKRVGTQVNLLKVTYTFPAGRGSWEYGCSCDGCSRVGLALSWKEIQAGKCPECSAWIDSSPVVTKSLRKDGYHRMIREEAAMGRRYAELEALFG